MSIDRNSQVLGKLQCRFLIIDYLSICSENHRDTGSPFVPMRFAWKIPFSWKILDFIPNIVRTMKYPLRIPGGNCWKPSKTIVLWIFPIRAGNDERKLFPLNMTRTTNSRIFWTICSFWKFLRGIVANAQEI